MTFNVGDRVSAQHFNAAIVGTVVGTSVSVLGVYPLVTVDWSANPGLGTSDADPRDLTSR